MTTDLIDVTGWVCDCCGDPHPRGRRRTLRADGVWEESFLWSVRAPLALSADGEDWICSACSRLLEIEERKLGPL